MSFQLLTSPVLAFAFLGVPWLLGASVVLGAVAMAVTALVRAGWRLARRRLRGPGVEAAERTHEEQLLDACTQAGMTEAEARWLLGRAVNAALTQASFTATAPGPDDATTLTMARPGPEEPTLSMQLPEVRRG